MVTALQHRGEYRQPAKWAMKRKGPVTKYWEVRATADDGGRFITKVVVELNITMV